MIDDTLGRMGGAAERPAPQWCAGFAPDVAAVVSAKGWRSPDDYQFQEPQDGFPYDPAHATWFRDAAHRIGLTGDQAGALHDAYIDYCRTCMKDAAGGSEDSLAEVRRAWGNNFPTRMAEARRALGVYVIEDAELSAIADQIGDVALMNLLAKIGRSLGEDSLVGGRASGAGGLDVGAEIRRVQAEARSDPRHPYLDKSHPEHDSTVRRMQSLFERAYGRNA